MKLRDNNIYCNIQSVRTFYKNKENRMKTQNNSLKMNIR